MDFTLEFQKVDKAIRSLTQPDEPLFKKPEIEDPIKVLRKHLLTVLEVTFWEDGVYPPVERLLEVSPNFEKDDIIALLSNETFTQSLENRGLPEYHGVELYTMNPDFVLACNLILDYNDKRSIAAKMKSLGKTTRNWNAWLRSPRNYQYYQDRVAGIFSRDLDEAAKMGLAQLIQSNDLGAIKYYHEFSGKFKPQQNEDVLVLSVVMARLMEVLVRFLTPDQLNEVAGVIETTERELHAGNG